MTKSMKRGVLYAILIIFFVTQGWAYSFHPAGGMFELHSFTGILTDYFPLSFADPLSTSAFFDFLVLQFTLLLWLLMDLPKGKRLTVASTIWLISFFLYPALGLLIYFLWLHPNHSAMADAHY